ncbi:acetate/propionate family kinase, partial [Ruthenibacterium lactatiformans]|uniref:acetate/propionate family kinase n=1 Tax=Ruthenibacterium lactatiformans TaxID=1550024 RepID=UPI003AF158F0
CHLGNGSSIAAIKDGRVIDTTMGLTPLDGFMMGTRSGAIDPSVVTFIMEKEGLSPKQMDDILNKKSGMLGISGVSSDDRDIAAAVETGNERAKLAWDMRTYEIIKYIGGYVAALGGADAIVFTAGIGENQDVLRGEILDAFAYLGLKVDRKNNATHGQEIEITTPDSAVRAFVIPTNEELVIARDTQAIVEG